VVIGSSIKSQGVPLFSRISITTVLGTRLVVEYIYSHIGYIFDLQTSEMNKSKLSRVKRLKKLWRVSEKYALVC